MRLIHAKYIPQGVFLACHCYSLDDGWLLPVVTSVQCLLLLLPCMDLMAARPGVTATTCNKPGFWQSFWEVPHLIITDDHCTSSDRSRRCVHLGLLRGAASGLKSGVQERSDPRFSGPSDLSRTWSPGPLKPSESQKEV